LQQVGVLGAELGADGNMDDPNENWFVVDCRNYVVHIQDAKTRKAVNLEGLWSGKDGLHKVSMYDDDAVEDYVAANPVPHDYTGGGTSYFAGDWEDTIKQLERNRWTATPRQPVVPKGKRKTSGRKQ
jgi:Ribosomal silencing factor during starvation